MTEIKFTKKKNSQLEREFVSFRPKTFYHFHADTTAKKFANYLTKVGYEACVVNEDTVETEVLNDCDGIEEVTIKRGEYWSPEYAWEDTYTWENICENKCLYPINVLDPKTLELVDDAR